MRLFPAQVGPGGEPVSDQASLTSSNANDVLQEEQNAITSSGQTLIPLANPADNTQLSQAMARYASGGVWGVDTGAADAYVIGVTGSFTAPDAYFDGMIIRFRAGNSSTGASTVNAFGIGVVDLVQEDASGLTANFITTAVDTIARYDSSAGDFFVIQAAGTAGAIPLATKFIEGLTWGNGTDADHDIDFATGSCRDGADSADIVLSSALTKQIDAAWSVGTNQGGLDTGTVAIDTWYYLWLIKRSDTGVVDALFSTSATAPTMPANYNLKRRIGAVMTDGSANILDIITTETAGGGLNVIWNTPILDISAAGSTTRANVTMTVPVGFEVLAQFNVRSDANVAGAGQVYIAHPDTVDLAPSSTASPLYIGYNGAGGNEVSSQIQIMTNTSAQIAIRSINTSTNSVATMGWQDFRRD